MPRKISEADLDRAAALIVEGATFAKAAAQIGRSSERLRIILKARGFKADPKRLPARCLLDLPEQRMVKDYVSGLSELAVSIKYRCARGTVRRIVVAHGVQPRGGSESMNIRMRNATPEQRAAWLTSARAVRFGNMKIAAYDASIHNHAIGPGEVEIADALEQRGLTISRQEMIGPYCVDILCGNVAVEIKQTTSMAFSPHDRSKRTKYLIECDVRVVYVVAESADAILTALNDIVVLIEILCRDPPALGEYRMIWCRFNRDAFHLNDDKTALIPTAPNVVTTVRKGHYR